jgi:hypothetical protein
MQNHRITQDALNKAQSLGTPNRYKVGANVTTSKQLQHIHIHQFGLRLLIQMFQFWCNLFYLCLDYW